MALPPNDPLLVNLIENYFISLETLGMLEPLHDKWYTDPSWLLQVP